MINANVLFGYFNIIFTPWIQNKARDMPETILIISKAVTLDLICLPQWFEKSINLLGFAMLMKKVVTMS